MLKYLISMSMLVAVSGVVVGSSKLLVGKENYGALSDAGKAAAAQALSSLEEQQQEAVKQQSDLYTIIENPTNNNVALSLTDGTKLQLKPGESLKIDAVYDDQGHVGKIVLSSPKDEHKTSKKVLKPKPKSSQSSYHGGRFGSSRTWFGGSSKSGKKTN